MINTYDFELIKAQEIPEINSKISLYRHKVTGAELLSVENEDENIFFPCSLEDKDDVMALLNERIPFPVDEVNTDNSFAIQQIVDF